MSSQICIVKSKISKFVVLCLCFSSISASASFYKFEKDTVSTILENKDAPDRGDWGDLSTCSNVSENAVIGFQLRVDYIDPLNEDNTGLNGIWLACGNPRNNSDSEDKIRITEWITSANESFGHFQRRLFCNNNEYAIGFQLKAQSNQGPLVDDVGAVNLKMICSDGEEIEGYDDNENVYPAADYTKPMICPEKMAVCGIQTQVDNIKFTGDNTALNNIRIQCCQLPWGTNNLPRNV